MPRSVVYGFCAWKMTWSGEWEYRGMLAEWGGKEGVVVELGLREELDELRMF